MLLVLHPCHKLEYFKKHKWESEWIEAARSIVQEEFSQSYQPIKGYDDDDMEGSCQEAALMRRTSGDAAEEELGLVCLVSSYTLPHQNSQPGGRGQQTAHSKVLSRRARDKWSATWRISGLWSIQLNKISHGGLWHNDRFTLWWELPKELQVLAHR